MKNKTVVVTSDSVPVVKTKKKMDKNLSKDLIWSVGAYFLPLLFSVYLRFVTAEGFVQFGEFPISFNFVSAVGMFFTGVIAYYWCFDYTSDDNIHLGWKALGWIGFFPLLALIEVPHMYILGWL